MQVRLRVLGPVDVVVDGETRSISSRSQRVVLSVLAGRANTNVSHDVLIDAIWPDGPPRTAVESLRTYVSRLRRSLGAALVGDPGGYRLEVDEASLDLLQFERLLDDARDAPAPVALDLADAALSLWRGPPFGDVGDIEALRASTARLEERWVTARESRVASLLACGRAPDSVAAAEELISEHPLRERTWAVLVEGLTSMARPTEALRAYQRAVDTLAEAGLEPTAELRRAEASTLTGVSEAPKRRAVTLPASSLVGRDRDRAELRRHLATSRIVTLTGPGGVGKTRLARTVAADVGDDFVAGAHMIELARIEDPAQVAAAVADELGLLVGPEGPHAALRTAGDLDLLVVIDNCEHVIDAAAAVVDDLASGGDRLRLLVTSREPLFVDGEQLWTVEPLTTSGPDGGVQLFVERRRAISPDFAPDAEELEVIAEIVGGVDGLPLAVEMAAAASATMPLTMVRDRLEDELTLPPLKRRDLDERQRTLQGLIDWSLRLVDDEARSMFRALSVFVGWVTVDDVARVTGHRSPFETLCRLADRSLLQLDVTGDEPRFGMLRTVRQRARDAAHHEGLSLDSHHAAWVVDAVTDADRRLRGPDERHAHDRFGQVFDDARAAMTWARHQDIGLAVRLAARLFLYGQSRLRDEPLGWATDLVDLPTDRPFGADEELVLCAAAQRAVNAGDLVRARELIDRAVALNDGTANPLVYEIVSDIDLFSGNTEAARAAAEVCIDAARVAEDPHALVAGFVNKVLAIAYGGDHDAAAREIQAFDPPVELAPSDRAWLHYLEGERLLDLEPEPALAALAQAVAIADSVGNTYLASVARVSYASLLSRTGDPLAATQPFAELIAHWRSFGDRTHLLVTLRNLVTVLDRLRMPERCAELLGTVLNDDVAPTFGAERTMLDDALSRMESKLGRPELERHLATGRERTLDEAAGLAQHWLEEFGSGVRRPDVDRRR